MTWESAARRERPLTAGGAATQNLNTDGGGTPGIWDVVYFANKPCVGIAEVNLTLGADIDKRRKKGQKKSKPIDCGAKPAEIDISLTLHAGQFETFSKDVAPLLFSLAKNEAQNPIAVGHPSLEVWGLSLFVVQSVSLPHPSKGLLKVSIKAVEWVEPAIIPTKQKVTTAREVVDNTVVALVRTAEGARTFIDKLF
jgi:hypothetical protein